MCKAGLSVVAKRNMGIWWNRQTPRIQNPMLSKRESSSLSIPTRVPFGASLIYFDTNSNKVLILARGLCVVGSSPTVRANMRT